MNTNLRWVNQNMRANYKFLVIKKTIFQYSFTYTTDQIKTYIHWPYSIGYISSVAYQQMLHKDLYTSDKSDIAQSHSIESQAIAGNKTTMTTQSSL